MKKEFKDKTDSKEKLHRFTNTEFARGMKSVKTQTKQKIKG